MKKGIKKIFPKELAKDFQLPLTTQNPDEKEEPFVLKILADFEGGSLSSYSLKKIDEFNYKLYIKLRNDTNSSKPYLNCFFFKLLVRRTIRLEVEVLGFYQECTTNATDKTYEMANIVVNEVNSDPTKKIWKFVEGSVYEKYMEGGYEMGCMRFGVSLERDALIALSFPYTYSQLQSYLNAHERKIFIKGIKEQNFEADVKQTTLKNSHISYVKKVVGASVNGVPIFLIELSASNFVERQVFLGEKLRRWKRKVLIIARLRPGDVCTSFVVEGVMNFLFSDENKAIFLLDFFEFYIFPMPNPDGVMMGNNRTNIVGKDLNNEWYQPSLGSEPEVVAMKEWMKKMGKLHYVIDLHANTKKHGKYSINSKFF